MDSDKPLVVNLEVSVPRIILSTNRSRQAQMEGLVATRQPGDSSQDEDLEQVRLMSPGFQQDSSPRQRREQRQGLTGEASARMTHSLPFRLFRISIPVPMQSQSFLFQVLRKYNEYIGKKRRKRNNTEKDNAYTGQLHATDTSAFSIEFRHLDRTAETSSVGPTPTPTSTLTPGLNQVVIFLDNEGTPASYSIDGAES